jgi:hypothetical protein
MSDIEQLREQCISDMGRFVTYGTGGLSPVQGLALIGEMDELRAGHARVIQLHKTYRLTGTCIVCGDPVPCATRRALEGIE